MQLTVDGVTYGKPNMAALDGELGRRIIETIRSTPRLDYSRLDRECQEIEENVRKARENGAY